MSFLQKSAAGVKGKTPLEEPFEFEDDPKAKLKGKAAASKPSKPSGKGKKAVPETPPEDEEPTTSGKGMPFGRGGRRGVRFGRVTSTNLATAVEAAIDAVDEGPAASAEKSGFSALHSVQWARIILDEVGRF